MNVYIKCLIQKHTIRQITITMQTYVIGNNNVPVEGIKYYSNKFGQVMTRFIVDSGDSILGENLIVTESATVHGKTQFKMI